MNRKHRAINDKVADIFVVTCDLFIFFFGFKHAVLADRCCHIVTEIEIQATKGPHLTFSVCACAASCNTKTTVKLTFLLIPGLKRTR